MPPIGKKAVMGAHVHVRVHQGMDVSAAGELVEHYHCRCGETWTKSYRIEDGDAEERRDPRA
ncbi:hypothetical protein [Streptomyces sp. NPDC051310]|uniref:hypothetical protein n=1 Tax=Streptomyces sp. NPDC051310 TaxID=3365649 RepID=UPI0037AB1CD3